MKNTVQGAVRRNLGYTIDQTILIVAVIAVLITLIIASVGWDLLSRAGGTKLASYFRQIEDANGQFYAKFTVWPHDAMNQAGVGARRNAAGYLLALKDRDAAFPAGNRFYDQFQDYLPGFTVDNVANPTTVEHTFGNGGNITQSEELGGGNCPGNSDFLRIVMTDVPVQEINEADENIDNGDGPANGRLRWGENAPINNGDNNGDGQANVAYCGNNVGF